MKRHPTYDAVIVGARCAGAATAMLLARQGARVMVIDHDQPGTDTMSTHAVMRTGVFLLRKWGLLDVIAARGTPALRRETYVYGDRVIDREIREEHGVGALYAPRRQVLDLALVEAAAEAGVDFRFGTGCRGLSVAGGRVRGVTVEGGELLSAGIVIGADGRRSAVARHVGAPVIRQGRHLTACAYAYVEGHGAGGLRFDHVPGAVGGIIPTNDGLACVFVAMAPGALRAARRAGQGDPLALAARHLPDLAAKLCAARMVTRPVFYAGEAGYVRRSAGPGWALAGDAGYFRDPCTAHGISDALRDAELLSAALAHGRPEAYPAQRDAMSAPIFEASDRIAALDWTLEGLLGLHVAASQAMQENLRQVADGFGITARAA